MSYAILFLRSTLFALGFWLSFIVYLPALPVVQCLPLRKRFVILRGWNWLVIGWLRLTCGVRWRVEGEVPEGGGVILANHQSSWETIFLPLVVLGPAFVLKRELLRVPIFGWGLALAKPIAIDRAAGRDALKQILTQGRQALAQGRWVVVFPEGTRTAPGKLAPFKPGGAMLATQNGARVLPIAHNAGCAWPRGSFIKYPCTITFRIGPVIETAGRSAGEVNAEVEAWVRAQLRDMPCPQRKT